MIRTITDRLFSSMLGTLLTVSFIASVLYNVAG